MIKFIQEGNLTTGMWRRDYKINDKVLFIAFRGGVSPLPSDPEREWGGCFREEENEPDSVERYLEENNILDGVARWETIGEPESARRVFLFKEKDFGKILEILDSCINANTR